MSLNRIPLVPVDILKAHKAHEPSDTRFTAAARLLQALWREDMGFPIGTHRTTGGKRRKLGSRIDHQCGKLGGNFISPAVARLALRESVYRELGAVIEQERLWTNLLSSQPLCFNLFGGMKLDKAKASQFFTSLFPDYVATVEGVQFEHSPGRGNAAFTEDQTAFDVFVNCTDVDGSRGFIAIEVKYSESMTDRLTGPSTRYDDLSRSAGIYITPDAPELRRPPLQQLWREHLLARSMIGSGLYSSGRFVTVYPAQNHQCAAAVRSYRNHLASQQPATVAFQAVTLEDCITALRAIGDDDTASALYNRYLDFERVEREIFGPSPDSVPSTAE